MHQSFTSFVEHTHQKRLTGELEQIEDEQHGWSFANGIANGSVRKRGTLLERTKVGRTTHVGDHDLTIEHRMRA